MEEICAQVEGELVWKVQSNEQVIKGQIVGEIHIKNGTADTTRENILAPNTGMLHWTGVNGQQLTVGEKIAQLAECTHDLLKGDICMMCLKRVSQDERGKAVKVMFSHGQAWHLNQATAGTCDVLSLRLYMSPD